MIDTVQSTSSDIIRSQWSNPSGVVDLLLLVGGDVIQTSLAQLTGDRVPAPVVFSFGWVAYAFIAIAAVVGDNRLLRKSDTSALLINGSNGFTRSNKSWIIGRILRDFETGHWMGESTRKAVQELLKKSNDTPKTGLCVSFFESRAASGSLLAVIYGSLQIWRDERWAARILSKEKSVILTGGNGAQHALVIFCREGSLDLEDLSTSDDRIKVSLFVKVVTVAMLMGWFVLLLSVISLEKHLWFLVAIGLLGMLYCIAAAGAPQKPQSYGIDLVPFRPQPVIANRKVMPALFATETAFPAIGRSMLKTFFPGDISLPEEEFWTKAQSLSRIKWPLPLSSAVDGEAVRWTTEIQKKIQDIQDQIGSTGINGI
ncbi:MAG: hypothetical protein Q9187_004524 [Circinaria calcarea]